MTANSNPYRKTTYGEESIRPRIPLPDRPTPPHDTGPEDRPELHELDTLIGSMNVHR